MTATDALTGTRKAALLLLSMGKERSAKIMSSLRENEVEQLSAEIARLDGVPQEMVDGVVQEFAELVTARGFLTSGGVGIAHDLLIATLGAERAAEVMSRLTAAMMEMPFQFLRRADPRQLLSFLHDEHPQTIALVLAHMGSEQAASVLGGLHPELQADVAHRLAVMERTSPETIAAVEGVLERKLSSVLQPTELSSVGGLDALVEVINQADRGTERLILEGLEKLDPALAEQVRSQMFVFEDITLLEDRAVQLVLRNVETAELAVALKGVRADVRAKVLSNMSERAAEALAEEIEMLGPVRLKTVEEGQAKVVHAIRALEESGQIVISRGGEDEFVS